MANAEEQPSATASIIVNGVALIVLSILAGVSGYYPVVALVGSFRRWSGGGRA